MTVKSWKQTSFLTTVDGKINYHMIQYFELEIIRKKNHDTKLHTYTRGIKSILLNKIIYILLKKHTTQNLLCSYYAC